ncbi:Nuclear import receptor, partial [Massospora cicadina]
MSYTLEDQVLNALGTMYSPQPDPQQILRATNFLEQFQKQVEAWTIADKLLREPHPNANVQFFMAQTLRQKVIGLAGLPPELNGGPVRSFRSRLVFQLLNGIKNQLIDLNTGARFSLRDSLLEAISSFKDGPPAILTQLCLGLASLVIQLVEWHDAVPHLIRQWGQAAAMRGALLQFLTVLPQEVNSVVGFGSLTDDQFRQQATLVLTNNGSQLLLLLVQFMQLAGGIPSLQGKVFACLISWLKSGDIAILELKDSPLVGAAFDAVVQVPELFEMATEIICSMVYETREVQSCMPVVQVLLPRLVQLFAYLKAREHDEDTLQGLCRIFSEAGEAYLELIIEHPQPFRPVVEAIVECLRICPVRSLSATFSFWYSLANSLRVPDEAALFAPVFETTLHAIIGRLAFPRDSSEWTLEDEDSFRDFRHEIGDILKDCTSRLRGWLQQHEAGAAPAWQELEAALFSVRSMGSEVRPEDKSALRGIMELFPRLPPLEKIRYTATLVLCRYADWTRFYPELLPFQLGYVAQGLDMAEVAPASSMALESFGRYCGEYLVPHLPELGRMYANYVGRLDPRELLEITACIGHVLAWVPADSYLSTFDQYVDPILLRIQALAPQISDGGLVLDEISFNLDRLHRLYENGLSSTPALPLVQKVWPLVEGLIQHLVSHPAISEALCRLFRCIISALAPRQLPYQPALAAAFLDAYERTGFSCYMWVLSKFIESYYSHETQPVAELLVRTSQLFLTRASQCAALDEMPQVVEEFSYMLTDALKAFPLEFLSLQTFPSLLQFYVVALDMRETHALEASLYFLSKLLASLLVELNRPGKAPSDFPLVGLIQQVGGEYVARLVTNARARYPLELVDEAVGVVAMMSELGPQSCVGWISQAWLGSQSLALTSTEPNAPSPPLKGLTDQLSRLVDQSSWRPGMRRRRGFDRATSTPPSFGGHDREGVAMGGYPKALGTPGVGFIPPYGFSASTHPSHQSLGVKADEAFTPSSNSVMLHPVLYGDAFGGRVHTQSGLTAADE